MSINTILTTTEELIRFRTTKDRPDEMDMCAKYIEDFFADTSLTVNRIMRNDVESVVVTKGVQNPKIFLVGHFDVVEGDDEQFVPQYDDDKLYARGAVDMKASVAVMMHLMKELADTEHDIGLLLTGDEERGGFDGVGHLLEQGYSCEAAVLPDGGFAVNKVVTKAKGILWLRISAYGKAVHGSTPWRGDNAILKIRGVISTLTEMFEDANNDAEGWKTTCSINQITGGNATNQVPESVQVECDIRYTEDDTPAQIQQRIIDALPEHCVVKAVFEEPMTYVEEDNPFIQAYFAAAREHGHKPHAVLEHGSTDGRFFSARNIPVIISQPQGDNHHGLNEWVSIASIEDYATVLKTFVENVAK